MAKRHIKRLAAPKTWNIERKGSTFIQRPLPGAHTLEHGVALSMMLTQVNAAKTASEIKYLLNTKQVLVDGRRRKEPKFMIGLMDVLSLPETNQHYRVVLNPQGYLVPVQISQKETGLKIAKIIGKTMLSKGTIQLNLSDGRNIRDTKKNSYAPGDIVLISIPEQEIKQHLKLEKGSVVYLIGGKHKGTLGIVQELKRQIVTFATKEATYTTPAKYTLVVGTEKPLITVTEELV